MFQPAAPSGLTWLESSHNSSSPPALVFLLSQLVVCHVPSFHSLSSSLHYTPVIMAHVLALDITAAALAETFGGVTDAYTLISGTSVVPWT